MGSVDNEVVRSF